MFHHLERGMGIVLGASGCLGECSAFHEPCYIMGQEAFYNAPHAFIP